MITKGKALAAALKFVNAIRSIRGLGSLKNLPKGNPGKPESCPIAYGIEGTMNSTEAVFTDVDGRSVTIAVPEDVRTFVSKFDEDEYPPPYREVTMRTLGKVLFTLALAVLSVKLFNLGLRIMSLPSDVAVLGGILLATLVPGLWIVYLCRKPKVKVESNPSARDGGGPMVESGPSLEKRL